MAEAMEASNSFASRRFRLIQAKKRSTTHAGVEPQSRPDRVALDDFDGDGCGGSDGVAGIAAIGEDLSIKGKDAAMRAAPVPRHHDLDAGLMRFKHETRPSVSTSA